MKYEPVAVTAVIRAIAVLLSLLGITLTDHDIQTVVGFIAAAYALFEVISTLITRSKVSPVAKLKDQGRA